MRTAIVLGWFAAGRRLGKAAGLVERPVVQSVGDRICAGIGAGGRVEVSPDLDCRRQQAEKR